MKTGHVDSEGRIYWRDSNGELFLMFVGTLTILGGLLYGMANWERLLNYL